MCGPPKLDLVGAFNDSRLEAVTSSLMSARILSLPEIVAKAKAEAG